MKKNSKKAMKCELPGCQFQTEFLPDGLALDRLKLHVTLQHQAKVEDKSSAREGDDSSNTENNSKAVYKAVKCSVSYKKNQSFDSFEREIKSWIEATKGIPEYAKNLMFIEMLASTENEEVKRFYSTNI